MTNNKLIKEIHLISWKLFSFVNFFEKKLIRNWKTKKYTYIILQKFDLFNKIKIIGESLQTPIRILKSANEIKYNVENFRFLSRFSEFRCFLDQKHNQRCTLSASKILLHLKNVQKDIEKSTTQLFFMIHLI